MPESILAGCNCPHTSMTNVSSVFGQHQVCLFQVMCSVSKLRTTSSVGRHRTNFSLHVGL